jgi:hypothetical protein
VSNELGANRNLGLIDSLKSTVEDVGARVKKLVENFHLTLARESRRHETSLDEQARQLSSASLKAEASFQQAKTAAQARFERRKAWIGKAYQSSREQALRQNRRARSAAEGTSFKRRCFKAERDRDAGLASTAGCPK